MVLFFWCYCVLIFRATGVWYCCVLVVFLVLLSYVGDGIALCLFLLVLHVCGVLYWLCVAFVVNCVSSVVLMTIRRGVVVLLLWCRGAVVGRSFVAAVVDVKDHFLFHRCFCGTDVIVLSSCGGALVVVSCGRQFTTNAIGAVILLSLCCGSLGVSQGGDNITMYCTWRHWC